MDNIESRVSNLEDRISKIEALLSTEEPRADQFSRESTREFLNSHTCKSMTDKCLVLSYYHEIYLHNDGFTTQDVASQFSQAREPKPHNISDLIGKNINKGYIMEGESDNNNSTHRVWMLTNSGIEYVKNIKVRNGK